MANVVRTKQYKVSEDLTLAKASLDLLADWLRSNSWQNVQCTVTKAHRFAKAGSKLPLVDFAVQNDAAFDSGSVDYFVNTGAKTSKVSAHAYRRLLNKAANSSSLRYDGYRVWVDSVWLNAEQAGCIEVLVSDEGSYVKASSDEQTHNALLEFCTTGLTPGIVWTVVDSHQLTYIIEGDDSDEDQDEGDGGQPSPA